MNIFSVQNLKTYFFTSEGTAKAVDGISFDIAEGEILCLVGESGCGKSVTSLSMLNLVPKPGKIVGGELLFRNRDILRLSEKEIRKIRGKEISLIFQEPMTSLNPVFTVGNQVAEVFKIHAGLSSGEARKAGIDMFRKVKIPDPDMRFNDYPHQLSGGMQQRVMIAMALACKPALLIADEPTTALDVTIQSQILELLCSLRDEFSMSILFITHDLGIVSEIGDRVIVMYSGKIVETGLKDEIIHKPKHPYTAGLLNSIPELGTSAEKLNVIPGQVPSPLKEIDGCRFNPRCPRAVERCFKEEPQLFRVEESRKAACFNMVG